MSGNIVNQTKLPFKPASLKAAEQEASLALYVAQHSSIAPVDHLSEMCKKKFSDAIEIRLHRTKCTNIIKNVLAPHFFEELRTDIGDSKFSLLLDESTDISVTKLLGIVIIYFSKTHNRIISTFLSLAELENADSGGIVDCLKKELKKLKLNINKLIGIGTDNANVMRKNNNKNIKRENNSSSNMKTTATETKVEAECYANAIKSNASTATAIVIEQWAICK
ncbi:PREDICTED: uncharacterized protein LOC108374302 [Rhagoletis zephyria]|uniref:uncharacterized protein LOC108374302 n=1 Tax=Rhagoletis zephyria TaxID=28612 RepID=UPI0008115B4F|nr:PREDICTED: uncharacterized protein LOC108374302 [Rhagoletis zephyria]